jgi:uncharacterized membrane protein YbhN (UPF0104 family)
MLLVLSLGPPCGIALLFASHPDLAREFGKNLTAFPVSSLAVALLLVLTQVSLQSLRFWAVIPPDAGLGVVEAARIFTLGDWANLFAPARGGDVLKMILMKRAEGGGSIKLPWATGAVLADKVVDVGSLFLVCAITGSLGLVSGWAGAASVSRPLALVGAGIAALLLATIVVAGSARTARLRDVFRQLLEGLSALKHPARCPISVSLGVGAWAAELVALGVLCAGLGFSPSAPHLAFAVVLLNVGITVPISFASLGVYEACLAYGLSQSGLTLPSAIAAATAHHVLEVLGIGLCAAAFSLPIRVLRRGTSNSVPGGIDAHQAPLSCGPEPGLPKGTR